MTAFDDIRAERLRQIEGEGWTVAHDDEHTEGALAMAAACYAIGGVLSWSWSNDFKARWWPWDEKWWKPKDKRRNLIKAGALIVAEIERLDRADLRATKST